MTRPAVYTAVLGAEAVSASTGYVLVDLSDTTNFPHGRTSGLRLLGVFLTTEKAGDGAFDIWLGVVTENDATDGSVAWVRCYHLEAVDNPTDSTDRRAFVEDFTLGGANPDGINLLVSSGATPHLVSNQSQANNAGWQNDVGLASPVGAAGGATGKPAAGDLVVWVEEVSGTGTLDFCLTALYGAV